MSTLRNPVDARDHADGPADAPVTVVEYGDYECPYCGAAHPVVKQLKQQFGDRLRLVFRDFPIAQLHANAMEAAGVAAFGAELDRYWPIHDALFEHQDRLGWPLYVALATEQGLDADALRDAVGSGRFEPDIRRTFYGGLRSGVNGTPTFYVNGVRLDMSRNLGHDLRAAIEDAATAATR